VGKIHNLHDHASRSALLETAVLQARKDVASILPRVLAADRMKDDEYKALHEKTLQMVREAHEAYVRALSSLMQLEMWQKTVSVFGPKS
jgi:hypothetical protein